MKNREIAQIFSNIADLMEIKDENPFKIRAYRKAALNLEALSEDIESMVKEERLTSIPGVGKDLAEKIKEYLTTGRVATYEELKKQVPSELLELMKVPGLGPKKVKLLYQRMNVTSIDALEKLAKEGKLRNLPGMGSKSEENILKGIALVKKGRERIPLGIALPLAEQIIEELKKSGAVKQISAAGSLRRKKETIRDIDILVTSDSPKKVMDRFTALSLVKEVLVKGPTKSSIRTEDDIQVDLRVVEPDSFGAALQYFTGSKNHNIHLRTLAQKKGLKINEYGVFREKDNKKIAGKTERDVYQIFEMPWIPPEIREDRGEIEAALEKRLPKLVAEDEIKGDLHVHSNWSDGGHSLEEIIEFVRKRGYQYVAITDHSKSLGVARGLDEKRIVKQIKELERIEKKYDDFRILKGIEVDIRADGTLDLDPAVLEKLDIVIGAIHTGFKQGKEQLTKRLIKAMETGLIDFISHPTSRLMGERDSYELDWEKILKVAKKTGTGFEINAYYLRLDLDDINSRRVKEEGIMIEIGTDAHFHDQLDMMRYGLAVARRAWLEAGDLLNTYDYDELIKYLKSRKRKGAKYVLYL